MSGLLTDNLWFPAVLLAALGWIVPALLARRFPEGLGPLMVLGFVATLILFALATALFFLLYVAQGTTVQTLGQFGLIENLFFFGRLGLNSALIWAPIMILSVMNRPRHWTKETW